MKSDISLLDLQNIPCHVAFIMDGKQITASQVISSNGKVNIDLNNVEAGVYLVRVRNETFSTTVRIVIEK